MSKIDFSKVPDHLLGNTCGDDASKWAAAFMYRFGLYINQDVLDEGTMIGWFANAIEEADLARNGSSKSVEQEILDDISRIKENVSLLDPCRPASMVITKLDEARLWFEEYKKCLDTEF